MPTGGYAVSAVAANDNGAFGVWRHTHAGFAMITNFVDGAVMNAEAAPVAAVERSVFYGAMVAVATDGRDYLLATSDRGNISAKIIDAIGEDRSTPVVISAEFSTSSSTGPIDATWNGREYVIAATLNNGAGTQLQLATVSASGELRETAAGDLGTSALAVVPAGDGRILVAFRDNDSVRIAFPTACTSRALRRPFPASQAMQVCRWRRTETTTFSCGAVPAHSRNVSMSAPFRSNRC